ncbi:hypothetical protein GJ496_004641 [Pomphorhynchus laevis]|nr:hypothetical protein GJ496_003184 [Pomphorhynchus laevis]KAI0988139.1 hypothetical protein GJ496_004641 [Pomphorhynchus laevis]
MHWSNHKLYKLSLCVASQGEFAWEYTSKLMNKTFRTDYFTPLVCIYKFRDLVEELRPVLTGKINMARQMRDMYKNLYLMELQTKMYKTFEKYAKAKEQLEKLNSFTPEEVNDLLIELWNVSSEVSSDDPCPEKKFDKNVIIAADLLMSMTSEVDSMLDRCSANSSLPISNNFTSTMTDNHLEVENVVKCISHSN